MARHLANSALAYNRETRTQQTTEKGRSFSRRSPAKLAGKIVQLEQRLTPYFKGQYGGERYPNPETVTVPA